ncbi:MAG: formylglycine-generating enzyme family protein [Spirochaetaceae bacterium]|nr:formylglycine-generating enzyme family protein [Spirochaetaceae bacterium]
MFGTNSYRLPTEAQWEYAARGGGPASTVGAFMYQYAGSNTHGNVAWSRSNSNSTTHTVGTKLQNTAGLYDMSGNVSEFCWDYSDGPPYPSPAGGGHGFITNPHGTTPILESDNNRIIRGGHWDSEAYYSGSEVVELFTTYRGGSSPPTQRSEFCGFRVVCWD